MNKYIFYVFVGGEWYWIDTQVVNTKAAKDILSEYRKVYLIAKMEKVK